MWRVQAPGGVRVQANWENSEVQRIILAEGTPLTESVALVLRRRSDRRSCQHIRVCGSYRANSRDSWQEPTAERLRQGEQGICMIYLVKGLEYAKPPEYLLSRAEPEQGRS